MSKPSAGHDNLARHAHLLDDTELGVRTFPRGTRQLGDTCKLIIAFNGDERLVLEEEAGDRAPRELVVDVRTGGTDGSLLLSALRTRPWACPDSPVLICPTEDTEDGICYLIRTPEISEMFEVIRDGLDIESPGEFAGPQTGLDAAAAGG